MKYGRFWTIVLYMVIAEVSMLAQTPIVDIDWVDSPKSHLSDTKDGKAFQCYGTEASGVRDNTTSWMVNKGTASNPIWARNTNYCSAVRDPATGQWMGTTQNTAGYFLMFYDRDDALGKAFSTRYSLEAVVRFDDPEGFYYSGGKEVHDACIKFISTQQNGGWSLVKYSGQEDLCFEYAMNAGTETAPKMKNFRCRTGFRPEPGKFYHFVVTVNASSSINPLMRLYINGVIKGELELDKLPHLFPQCGTTTGQKNMWLCLGGDVTGTTAPDRGEANGRLTFADFKIYDTALFTPQVKNLYNKEEVRNLTTPAQKKNDLLMDVVFSADRAAVDAAKQQALLVAGKPTTQYNAELHRYEMVGSSVGAGNYFYAPLGATDVNTLLADGFSIEVFCKLGTSFLSSDLTPFGFEEDGGGASLTFAQNGVVKFPCHTKSALRGNGSQYTLDAATLTTPSRSATTEYTHYVLTYDRIGGTGSHMYVNGEEKISSNTNKVVPCRADFLSMPYAPNQYVCVGGDIKGSTLAKACEAPFRGNIVSARIWGRALSAEDAKALSQQASATSVSISIPMSGYTTICLPFAAMMPTGVSAYIVQADSKSMALYAKEGEVIPYGTPLILNAVEGDYTFQAVDLQTVPPLAVPADNMLEGSFAPKTAEYADMYTLVDGKYQMLSPGSTLPAMSAWLSEPVTLAMGDPKVDTYSYTLCGSVLCEGKGLSGVHVSDGINIATTDSNGRYTMYSQKKLGYVFVEIPSGYMPTVAPDAAAAQTAFPAFWQSLSFPDDKGRVEVHDFHLQPQSNGHHLMLFGADTQFTGDLRNDVGQFKQVVMPKIRELCKNSGSVPVYSTMLGDLSFDYKWNTFNLQSYHDLLVSQRYPMPHFSVIGNHDYNSWMPPTDSISLQGSADFRAIMGPTYYSFNLGKAHYVVLDNVDYTNEDYSTQHGVKLSSEQLDWLRKDLANVDKSSPLFISLHCPVWRLDNNFNTVRWVMSSADVAALQSAVNDFKEVHVMTGHHHNLQVMQPAPNITEHTLMAVGGNLWATGEKSNYMVCDDGTPGGYLLFDINGEDVTYRFYSWQHDDAQFRVIDVNEAKKIYEENSTIQALLKEIPAHTDYRTLPGNSLLINVFNFDSKWNIQVFEGDKQIVCTRRWLDDISSIALSEVYYYKGPGQFVEFKTINSSHIFLAQAETADQPITIRVTDRWGDVHTHIVERPMSCTADGLIPQSVNETGISWIYNESSSPAAGIYNLSGQRVDGHYRGIVIRGGKKILMH